MGIIGALTNGGLTSMWLLMGVASCGHCRHPSYSLQFDFTAVFQLSCVVEIYVPLNKNLICLWLLGNTHQQKNNTCHHLLKVVEKIWCYNSSNLSYFGCSAIASSLNFVIKRDSCLCPRISPWNLLFIYARYLLHGHSRFVWLSHTNL